MTTPAATRLSIAAAGQGQQVQERPGVAPPPVPPLPQGGPGAGGAGEPPVPGLPEEPDRGREGPVLEPHHGPAVGAGRGGAGEVQPRGYASPAGPRGPPAARRARRRRAAPGAVTWPGPPWGGRAAAPHGPRPCGPPRQPTPGCE